MDALAESNRSLTAPFGALVLMLMMCSYSKSPKSTENSSSSLTRQLKPPLPTGPINSQLIHGLSLTQIASRKRSARAASDFCFGIRVRHASCSTGDLVDFMRIEQSQSSMVIFTSPSDWLEQRIAPSRRQIPSRFARTERARE